MTHHIADDTMMHAVFMHPTFLRCVRSDFKADHHRTAHFTFSTYSHIAVGARFGQKPGPTRMTHNEIIKNTEY